MPIIKNATTKSSSLTWTSPDQKINLYSLVLLVNGQSVATKTYSGQIASEGWTGDVETYQKTGKDGKPTTFVKQIKKDSPYQRGDSKSTPQDMYTMYLSYAKDLAIALVNTTGFDNESFNELLKNVTEGGNYLYGHRPGAEPVEEPEDKIIELNDQPIQVDIYDE
jgi:hypothetical protein